jgi:hypothetical protein
MLLFKKDEYIFMEKIKLDEKNVASNPTGASE